MSYQTQIDAIAALVLAGQGNVADDTPSYNIFQHNIDDTFEVLKEYTAKGSMYSTDEKGQSLFDRYAVSEDEKNIFRRFLKIAADKVYRQLGSMGKEVVPYFIFNEGPMAPAYAAGTTYPIAAYVSYNGNNYVSLQATNTGKTPGISTSVLWWSVVTSTYPSICPYVAAQTYAINDYCTSGGIYYKSILGTNMGQTPVSSPTYWTAVSSYVDSYNKITIVISNLKSYDEATYEVMSNTIFQIYQKYPLAEWYKLNKNAAEFQLAEAELMGLFSELKVQSFRRIQPMYRTGSII